MPVRVGKKWMPWLGIGLVLVALAVGMFALPVRSAGPMYTRQERFGIAFVSEVPEGDHIVLQSISEYNVAPLQVGWYSDWKYSATPAMPADATLEYVQLIRVGDSAWPPDWDAVRNAVLLNPEATWIIGNEPECPNQDAVTPEVYAQRYHEAYTKIKGWSLSAKIAIGGIVEPTPLRFRWLEKVMQAYEAAYGSSMEVDVWNIHIQILPEGAPGNDRAGAGVPVGIDPQAEGLLPRQYTLPDCANVQIFETMVWDFRDWMKTHGQQDKPLIISEMGVLQPSIYLVEGGTEQERKERGDQLIEQFMVQVFDWLLHTTDEELGCPSDEYRLVQRWLWFSLNGSFWDETDNPRGFNGSLYDYKTKELTRFGRRFVSYQNQVIKLYMPFVKK